jgi:hypothetical protein
MDVSTYVAPTTPPQPFHGGLAHSTQTDYPQCSSHHTRPCTKRHACTVLCQHNHDIAPSCHRALFYLCQRNHSTLEPCCPCTTPRSVPAPSFLCQHPYPYASTLASTIDELAAPDTDVVIALASARCGLHHAMRLEFSGPPSRKDWRPPSKLPKRGPATSLHTHRSIGSLKVGWEILGSTSWPDNAMVIKCLSRCVAGLVYRALVWAIR